MPKLPSLARLLTVVALAFLCCLCSREAVHGQDEPSLGDIARQTRLQTQRAQANRDGSNAQRVITNDEIPEHASPAQPAATHPRNRYANYRQPNYAMPADYVKQQILTQKQAIARQESEIERVTASVRYPGNCVTGCAQWNERLQEQQRQIERMNQMLETMKANLETAQEMARKQGFGSAVYDP